MPTSADSYVHRVGRTGRAGQNGRADLVLLPFEGNVIHTALRKFPLQPLTVADLQEETLALAQSAGAGNIENHLENLDEVVTSRAMENFDDEELRDVFMSMIGFYMGRTADIGGSKLDILHGLQQWSTEVAGMTEPPHISPTMMAKMGLTKELRGPKRQNRVRLVTLF